MPEEFGWCLTILSYLAIAGVFIWYFKPPKKSDTPESRKAEEAKLFRQRPLPKSQYHSPEDFIREGVQKAPCILCGHNSGLESHSDYCDDERDLLCPDCKRLYRDCLAARRYPPEVKELLEAHPEYESRLSAEEIMKQRTWVDYRLAEKRLQRGEWDSDYYSRRYAEFIKEQIHTIEDRYAWLKREEQRASLPNYDPARDSKF